MGGRGQFNPDGGFYRYDFEEDSRVTLPESFNTQDPKGKHYVKVVRYKDYESNKVPYLSGSPNATYIVVDQADPTKIYCIAKYNSDRTWSYVVDFTHTHEGYKPHVHVGGHKKTKKEENVHHPRELESKLILKLLAETKLRLPDGSHL
ncbi:MAG: hypothetical protein IK083_03700 [Abditibacteriota bacterium]|nr:hypothetical protein [Abditibacteriota bacterium]